MTNELKNDLKTIQGMIFEAYKTSGQMMALLEGRGADPSGIAGALDKMTAQYESGVVALRNLCEKNHPGVRSIGKKPTLPQIRLSGKAEVNEYGWLHIELNALLPNCRFQTPAYLTDTISRLLDEYESRGRSLPYFDSAMLVVDEHCDIPSRQVFDQDNKGWKAIPNALKGRVVKDDDQFTLNVSLVSTKSEKPACHIYLLPQDEAGDFFYMKQENYPMFP